MDWEGWRELGRKGEERGWSLWYALLAMLFEHDI